MKLDEGFILWFKNVTNNGYQSYLDIEQMELLLNKIIKCYELGIPSTDIDKNIINVDINKVINIKYYFLFDELLKTLTSSEVCAFNCPYRLDKAVQSELVGIYMDMGSRYDKTFVLAEQNGKLIGGLDKCLNEYVNNIHMIRTIEQLYNSLTQLDLRCIDYSTLERCVENHRNDLMIRNYLFDCVIKSLINPADFNIDNGIFRAKNFVESIRRKYSDIKIDREYATKLELIKSK